MEKNISVGHIENIGTAKKALDGMGLLNFWGSSSPQTAEFLHPVMVLGKIAWVMATE